MVSVENVFSALVLLPAKVTKLKRNDFILESRSQLFYYL
jgi:hypothetical protein